VWKEDMKEMVVNGVTYDPSNIPEKDLKLIESLAERKKISSSFFSAIRDVYRSLTSN
jgi:3-hydroxyisobutyrate dehydrogenase-like beta-hydroxyacid dehydrogenase